MKVITLIIALCFCCVAEAVYILNELGTFNFMQGNNKLVLHDKHVDPKFYVIADAVKWVKVE